MRLQTNSLLFLVLFLLTEISCQFTTDEENFVDIPSEPIKSITVNLSDLSDTLELVQPMIINYDVEFPKDVRFIVIVKIDETKVHESRTLPDFFEISPFQFPDGFYQMSIQIFTSSGTNSLADKLGYETVLFEVKKTVRVDKSPPQKINITKVEPSNGNLVVYWDKYPKSNFKSYLLYKRVYSEGSAAAISELYEITDRSQTFFTDPTYVGGKVDYYIVTKVTTSSQTQEGDVYEFYAERPKIVSAKTIEGQLLELKWNKPLFYNAFQQYVLRQEGNSSTSYFISNNINDTTTTISDLGFGIGVVLQLGTIPVDVPAGGGPSMEIYSTFKEVYLGELIPSHKQIFFNATNNLIYYYQNDYLFVMHEGENYPYDSINLTLNKSVGEKYSFGISHNGEYLYVGSGKLLFQLNPLTLDIINAKNLNELFSRDDLHPFAIAVGDQNLISLDLKVPFVLHQNGYLSDFIAIVDGETLALRDTLDTRQDVLDLKGNEDLSYLFEKETSRQRIINISNIGDVQNQKSYDQFYYGECYFSGSNAFVFMWSKRWVINLSTLNISQELAISDWIKYLNIDNDSGNVAGIVSSNGDFVVFDHVALGEVKRIRLYQFAESDIIDNDNRFNYLNGSLYSARGFKIKL